METIVVKIKNPNLLIIFLGIFYLLTLFIETNAYTIGNYDWKLKNDSKPLYLEIDRTSKRIDISKRSFSIPKIKYYTLLDNDLSNDLNNGNFLKDLPIESLDLRNNRLVNLKTEFIYFKELRFLDISNNQLEEFFVTSNPIEKVSSKLSTIWLNNNKIKLLPNLPSFSNLSLDFIQYVDLKGN
jgi:hypothetical protein